MPLVCLDNHHLHFSLPQATTVLTAPSTAHSGAAQQAPTTQVRVAPAAQTAWTVHLGSIVLVRPTLPLLATVAQGGTAPVVLTVPTTLCMVGSASQATTALKVGIIVLEGSGDCRGIWCT